MRFGWRPLLSLASLILASAGPVHALDLALVAGVNYHKPSLNPDLATGTTRASKAAFDVGVLASSSLRGAYRVEYGLLRHSRKRETETATAKTEIAYRGWLVPLSIQFMRAEFLGFGFGPYVAFLGGKTDTQINSTILGNSRTTAKDANLAGTDIGLRANLKIAVPVSGDWKAIGDFSYLLGFTDLNKSTVADHKNQEFLLLLGLQVPLTTIASLPSVSGEPKK